MHDQDLGVGERDLFFSYYDSEYIPLFAICEDAITFLFFLVYQSIYRRCDLVSICLLICVVWKMQRPAVRGSVEPTTPLEAR